MPTTTVHAEATVSHLDGRAWIRGADGSLRELHVGDHVREGETLVTATASSVELSNADGALVVIGEGREVLADATLLSQDSPAPQEAALARPDAQLDQVIQALNSGNDPLAELDAAAAGLTGGDGQDGHSFVQLLRISEGTDPLSLTSNSTSTTSSATIQSLATTTATTSANLAPTAADTTISTQEDTPVNGAVSATDANGNTLSYSAGTAPQHGSVVVNADGTFTYTPSANYNGSDSFTVTVSDGQGGTTTSTVNVGVAPVNDAPTTSNVTVSTSEDTPVTGSVTAADVDGDALTYSAGTAPQHGSVVVNADGTFTYTPAANYNGSDSFTVTVSDGQGGTTTSTVSVGIAAVNDAPTTSNVTVSTSEDTPVTGSVTAADVDGDALTYSAGTAPQHGSVVVNADGTFTYTPAANYNGADSFTVTVSDGQGGTTTSTVSVGIAAVNDAPTTSNVTVSTSEDTPVTGSVTAADVDGDALTYSAGTAPQHGSVVVNADGTFTYTPAANYNGADSFTVTVSDGQGGTTTSTVSVGIAAVNDAPTTSNVTVSTSEDTPVTGSVTAADVDGDALTYSAGTAPQHGSVVVNADGTFTYTPAANYNGSDSFTVTVSDGQGGTTTSTVSVGIAAVNDAPTTSNVTVSTSEDTPVTGSVTAADVDGDALSFAKGSDPAHGSVVVNADGTFTYTPAANYNGADSFTVTVSDGQGGTTTSTVSVGIAAVNDAPTTSNVTVSTSEDTPVTGSVTAADVDGDALTYSTGTAPQHGSVVVNADGTFTYTPAANYNGSDSFTVTVSDGQGGTTTSTVNVGVTAVNDAPTTSVVTLAASAEDTAHTITAADLLGKAADVEGDTLSVSNVSVDHGTLTANSNGTWTYTPDSNFNGQVSFSYTITDNGSTNGAADPKSVAGSATLEVTPVNDAPTTSVVTLAASAEDTAHTITAADLLGKAADVEGDTLSVSNVSVDHGTLTANSNGTWTYTPDSNFNGQVSFSYTITDNGSTNGVADPKSVAGSATLEVTPVNDAPTTSVVTLAASAEDTAHTITAADLLGKAADVEGDTLSVSNVSVDHGTLTANSNGTWTYTPDSNFNGQVSFSYTITDNGSTNGVADPKSVAGSATLEVTPVNDAPTTSVVTLAASAEDTAHTITAADLLGKAADVEGDTLSVSNVSVDHGTLTANSNGTWTYTPDSNFNGQVSFSYTITDNGSTNGVADPKSVAGSATLEVTPVNDAPTTSVVTLAASAEDTAHTITAADLLGKAADVEGDTLSVSNVSVDHGTLTANSNGTWTYTPDSNFNGQVSFSYTITDNGSTNGAADPKSVAGSATLEVTPVNDAPTTSVVTLAASAEDTAHTITAADLLGKAADVEGDTLSVSNVSVDHGTLTANSNGTWTYTPDSNFNGQVSFSYTITDSGSTNGAADPKSVAGSATLEVTPVNDAPTTSVVTLAASAEDTAHTITAADLLGKAADVEGDTLSVSNVSVDHGTLTANSNGTWTYTPDSNFNGQVSFSYTITDNGSTNGAADPKSVAGSATLEVTPVNDAPTTSVVTLAASAEDTAHTITAADLLGKAADVEGDTLSVSNVSVDHGTLTANSNGTWTYTPDSNFNGQVSFSYTITDNGSTNGVADPKSVAGSATLEVTPVNDAPTTSVVTLAASAEDTAHTITAADLLGKAADVEGDTLSVSNVSVDHGTLTANSNGTWTYTPDSNFNGQVSFSYTITDNGSTNGVADPKSVAGSATLEVTPVNDAPTTSVVTLAASAEDTAHTITAADLLGKAADVEGDTLSVSNVSVDHGTLTANSNGTWTYTPDSNFNGQVSFSYTITDNGSTNGVADPKSVAGSATLEVTPVNDAPTTSVVTLAASAEDTAHTITAADLLGKAADVEGDTLSVSNVSVDHGTLTANSNGTWTYTPDSNFNGQVSFSYTITDSGSTNGAADPKSVAGSATLEVTPVNDAPTTSVVTLAASAEDTAHTITAADLLGKAADVEGDTLSVSNVSVDHGTLTANSNGTWTYTPDSNFNGQVSFSYTITDSGSTNGAADPKSVAGSATLEVTPVNDAPTTSVVTLAASAEDTAHTITAADLLGKAADVEGDTLSVSNVSVDHGTLTANSNGTWTYTPDSNFNGQVSFSYTITDNGSTNGVADPKSVAGSATLEVTPVNDAPTTSVVTLAASAEDTAHTITAADLLGKAADVEGDTLSVSNVSVDHGTLTANSNGTWTYTPDSNFNGQVSFSYTITDSGSTNGVADPKSVAGSATLEVTPVNDAPTTSVVTLAASAEDTAHTITAADLLGKAADVEGDTLSVSNVSVDHGTLTANSNGTWTYTPDSNFNGQVSFSYTITDNGSTNGVADPKSVAGSATLEVTPVNDAPTTSVVTLAASAEDTAHTITAADLLGKAADVEGDTLSVSNVSVDHGTLTANSNGTWTYTPDSNFNGQVSFSYTITDNGSTNGVADPKSVAGSATLEVTPVNDAPTTSVVTLAASAEDTAHTITAADLLGKAADVEGDTLSVSNVSVDHGTLTANSNGTWTYTPDSNFNGQVSFSYTITDSGSTNGVADPKSVAGSATLEVTPVNDAPTTSNVTVSTSEDTPVTGSVTAADVDGDALTYSAGTAPQHGSVVVNADGTFTYTPAANYNGSDSFTVTVSDGQGGTTTSTVSVGIAAVNDPAVIQPISLTLTETDSVLKTGGSLAITDVDSPATFIAQSNVAGSNGYGHFTVNTDGSWTYTADSAHNEFEAGKTYTDSITVTSADGTQSTISIKIAGTNDAAVITPAVVTLTETDSVLSTGGTLAITDVDSPATFIAQSNVAGSNGYGHFTVNTDGSWTYTADSAHNEFEAGKTYTDSITVQSADGTPSTITVEIAGTNNAAVITGSDAGSVKEDTTTLASGTLSVTDADAGEASFQVQTNAAGAHGTFSIDAAGHWTYTLNSADPAVQALGEGQSLPNETFTVKSLDGTEHTVTVAITGTNDIASITGSAAGEVTEDSNVSASGTLTTGGTLTVHDVDTDAAHLATPVTLTGTYGSFTVDTASGQWTYSVDNSLNAIQALGDKQSLIDTITVKSADGTASQTLTVTIHGSNDAPTLTTQFFTTSEDTVLSGKLAASDAEGDTLSYALDSSAAHGSLTVNADGIFSYAPAANYNGADSFTVKVSDSHGGTTTSTVSIGVTPVNDAPTTSAVTLAGTRVKTTTITAAELLGKAADIDGDTLTVSNLKITSGNGYVTDNNNGTWTYTPSGTGTVNFSYTITDNGSTNGVSDPKSVTGSAKLTVSSSYHNATISGDNAGAVTEDGGIANATHGTSFDSGTLTIKDSDSGQASFQPANTLSGTYGSFTFNAATGAWTYTLDNSKPETQALTPSDTTSDSLTVYSLDGSASQTIKVTITGANDAPTVASSTVSGTEDTPLVLSWAQFHVTDVDGGSSSGITITSLPKDGQLQYYNGSSWVAVTQGQTISQTEIDANHLRFVPDANESGNSSYNTAGLGDQHADYASFSFTATDGISSSSSASITLDIAPVADGPVIQVNGSSIVAGAAIIATPALGDGLTTRTYVNLAKISTDTVDTTAEVSTLLTRLDAATTSLASTSISGTPQNYTPHSGSSPTGISEDGAYRMSGLIYMEAGKTYTFSSYMDDTAILKIGGQEVLNKAYNSWGNITATTFSPAVSGYYTLDWAVYNGNGVGAVKPYLSVDGGTALELTSSNFNLYSSVSTLDSTGAVHLGLVGDSSGGYYPAYNSSVEDTPFKLSPISVTLADTDGSEQLGSISISGLPEGSVITDGTHSFTATSGATSVVITSWSLSSLSFTPPHDFNGTVTLSLTATSTETATGQTGSTTATLPILVTGVNDAPVAVADNASVTEDSGSYTVNGSVTSNDTDVDGDKLHVAAVNGQTSLLAQDVAATYGSFHINADGSYTYQLANDNAQVNALNKGEVLHDTISYTVADPSGATSTATLTVTINGADETSANVIDSSLATVAGTAGADLIHASAANSIVDAGNGNDIVYGSDNSQATDLATLKTSNFMGANSDDTANHALGNVIHGGDGNDALLGGAHSDLLDGGAGNDYLSGGAGNDALRGGEGKDRIEGGAGSDVLMGGAGSDVFVWSLNDGSATAGTSTTGNSALGIGDSVGHAGTTDLVTDFTKGSGGDALDLRDLLQGESHFGQDPGNLANYLHFEATTSGGVTSTVVHVSSSGGFTGGTYNAGHEDQTIVLTGVNLLIDGSTSLLNDANIINNLLTNKNLITD
ncbi:retention module-containing protein [Niveibacterium terrae]|uniref:retention module-containing protein n=1 Tax=Niveibacterium terrae TaxID=3373598 RepID=UPI003A95D195